MTPRRAQVKVRSWRPRGGMGWTLTALAWLPVVPLAITAWYMWNTVNVEGMAVLGWAALLFPFHVLLLTVFAVVVGFMAWSSGTRLARIGCNVVAIGSALMAIVPTVPMWMLAADEKVGLWVGEYVKHSQALNVVPPQTSRTVSYGKAADGTNLELDVWHAPGKGLKPAVIRVHGGGWREGARGQLFRWNSMLNELGYTVFDIDYRLAPPPRWQDAVGDVKAALGWVVQNASEQKVDPDRLALMGHSAGAHLAMLAAYTAGSAELPPSTAVPPVKVRCVVNLYGACDLEAGYERNNSMEYVQGVLNEFIGGTPRTVPERYRLLSPINHVGKDTPPTITVLGKSDRIVPVEQAEILAAALAKAEVEHETWLLPGNDHSFDLNWGSFGTQFARAKVSKFLKPHMDKR